MKPEDFKGLALLTQIGITFVVCILVGVFLGRFLDGLLGTSPWLLLILSFLGVAAGFKAVYDLIPK